jgi:hypothetical protein
MSDEIIKPSAVTFDEEKLQRAVPFQLERTAIPGVYTIPAPPAGFDPRTASPSELIRAGFPWRRPDAESNPVARALWDRVMAREWRRAEAVPAVGRRLHRRPPGPMSNGPNINSNWAGAVLPTGVWDGVVGQWRIPQISQPPASEPAVYDDGFEGWEMSSWVGLGGYGPNLSNNLLQGGVAQQLVTNGDWGCYAWYQWWVLGDESTYQAVQIGPANFVNPNDSVFVSVRYVLDANNNPTGGVVWIANETTGVYVPAVVVPLPSEAVFSGGSAEWIVEAPDGGEWGPDYNGAQSSLPAFTPITFVAVACGPEGIFGPWANAVDSTVQEITTAQENGIPLTSTTVGTSGVTVKFVG